MNGFTDPRQKTSSWTSRCQLEGSLFKRAKNSKWSRRFFVLRDGYLLYYRDSEKKELAKRKYLNPNPKGIIPLAECNIGPTRLPGQPFSFFIECLEINAKLMLAAESEFERDKWVDMLEKSKRVTWQNCQLADEMIKQLEHQGLQMAKQKQDYFDRLQTEVMALSDEKERTETLEKVNQELAREKEKMEQFSKEMSEEYEKIKRELEETSQSMNDLELDRQELSNLLGKYQHSLQSLATDKERVINCLQEQTDMTKQLSKENMDLSEHKEQLQSRLVEIEQATRNLLSEKSEAEQRLRDNEEKTIQLQDEKQFYSEHANELQSTIKDLREQKQMTENELKEEVMARLNAERRLKNAENSLCKLDQAVEYQTPNIEVDVKEEMVVNVKNLKRFFEDIAAEAQLDANKPIIMRNSLIARKTLIRRAKTKKFESRRSSSGPSLRSKSLTARATNKSATICSTSSIDNNGLLLQYSEPELYVTQKFSDVF
ncbi:hypothetical protein ScPMuIL_014947 [Solemya velum]